MRTIPMCFSILRAPKSGIHTLANIWKENYHTLNREYGHSSWFNQLGFRIFNLEGGQNKRWTRKSMTTKAGRRTKTDRSSKQSDRRNEILEGSVSTSCTISMNKTETSEIQKLQHYDIQQTFPEKWDLVHAVTIIAFDIETTGFSRVNDRIIEIGFQDLAGGQNSTLQTLVNPECYVPNSHVHGITSHMVNRPDVPRMKEFIPILLQFVRSRQKPGGCVILAAHNARCFDVPFLIEEFIRCSFEIPPNWQFVDTLPLGRELMKSSGIKVPSRISVQALREHYGIPQVGSAHRAMADVRLLSMILQRLSFDLKLTVSDLVERSFTASDLVKKKKKN